MGSKHTEVPSPGVAAFIGFNSGNARNGGLIGRGVLITPPFVGPFCRSVGA